MSSRDCSQGIVMLSSARTVLLRGCSRGTFDTGPGIFKESEILRMPRAKSLKQQLLTG